MSYSLLNYYENGQKKLEQCFLNGQRHNENGPAFQEWFENGQKKLEQWYLNGERHRKDGPTFQMWDENGNLTDQIWYLNNKRHREDGPACTHYNGNEKIEKWFLNGKQLNLDWNKENIPDYIDWDWDLHNNSLLTDIKPSYLLW